MVHMEAIRVSTLGKSFDHGRVKAVNDVSFSINQGEIVALLGPNGAGKTTTIDMLLNLSQPDSGSVNILGGTPEQAIRAKKVSALLQTGGLVRDMKVGEAIDYIWAAYGNSGKEGRAVLDRVGIRHLENRNISKCSGGEQQRVKMALALLPDPEILILDEPTTGMDVQGRRKFWASMKGQAEQGRTIIFATHYLSEAEDFAQRIILMAQGKVVADGPTKEIQSLTGARLVSAVVDNMDELVKRAPELRGEVVDGRYQVRTSNSDDVARLLLAIPGVSDLYIDRPSLEDAFVSLTDADEPTETEEN